MLNMFYICLYVNNVRNSKFRVYFGKDPGPRGKRTPTSKNRFLEMKLQMFGTKDTKNLKKNEGFRKKFDRFWSFMGKFGQIFKNRLKPINLCDH